MKITVYTINDCQFSKAEKDYLQAHNLPYEEKNLETNKEYLTEMLAVANNFAGTPVTKIEKDDGQISILKGFTKEEFDKLTGIGQPAVAVVNSTMNVPTSPAVASAQAGPAPTDKPVPPVPVEEIPKKDKALNSVINNLQSKAEPFDSAPFDSAQGKPAETNQPPTINPPAGGLPNVPDFPKQ